MNEMDECEEELDRLEMQGRLADKRREIAERKALEKEAKRRHGSNWRKIVGAVGSLKKLRVNQEVVQTLHASNSDMRSLHRPRNLRRL